MHIYIHWVYAYIHLNKSTSYCQGQENTIMFFIFDWTEYFLEFTLLTQKKSNVIWFLWLITTSTFGGDAIEAHMSKLWHPIKGYVRRSTDNTSIKQHSECNFRFLNAVLVWLHHLEQTVENCLNVNPAFVSAGDKPLHSFWQPCSFYATASK